MTVGNHPAQLHAPSSALPITRRAFVSAGATLTGTGLLTGSLLGGAKAVFAQEAPAASNALTLAVVDFQPAWGDVSTNVESMKDLVAEAVGQGAQLILFPEMCVTGYVSSDDEADDDSRMCIEAAEGPDGATAAEFAQLAADNGIWIVYGGTEPVEGDDAHAYNSAFVCTWGSYASDPEAIDLVTAEIDYSDL